MVLAPSKHRSSLTLFDTHSSPTFFLAGYHPARKKHFGHMAFKKLFPSFFYQHGGKADSWRSLLRGCFHGAGALSSSSSSSSSLSSSSMSLALVIKMTYICSPKYMASSSFTGGRGLSSNLLRLVKKSMVSRAAFLGAGWWWGRGAPKG